MTNQLVPAAKPYGPPYAADRAWEPAGRDEWNLDAMRDGYTHALEAALKRDETKHPELAQPAHPGVEVPHFRSNRLPIDTDIVTEVMALHDDDLETVARFRRDTAEIFSGPYARQCLDAFQQDIIDAVHEAGMWDSATAARWTNHHKAIQDMGARWLP